ncbi:DUF2924 domain-containing protein [Sphingomonas montana]|uniref:DUF2924 domain-containing protein n=1 Tax=Sphingomonas montana TaxID=1843236 RepID=UPI0019D1E82F|nr:DUF2924 domain-containing protein [Sphingomonas montana]
MRTDDAICDIAAMTVLELHVAWETAFGQAIPSLPASLLRRQLAYRVQEQAERGLPAAVERLLDSLAKDPSTQLADPPIQLKPGTRLMREWNGRMHAVLVTDDGVLFDDQRYRSLSHVARAITGARWSGPRFFGLKPKGPPPVYGAARG